MSGSIDPINNIIIPGSNQKIPGRLSERPGSDAKRNIVKTSSKYIVADNKIVFERYDRYGKLISRIPWAAHSINEKA
jgi:hypothetical protein